MNINPAALVALLQGDTHNARVASAPGGIEAQEAAGQAEMVATSRLPKEGLDRALLESLGFVIGGSVNDLFVAATLPSGWELKATGHSMHTDIVDDKGRNRGSIFYKAAFYDERADMHMRTRYTVDSLFPCDANGEKADYNTAGYSAICIEDRTTEAPIHFIAINSVDGPRDRAFFDMRDEQTNEAREWLTSNFPDHKNPAAYWND